MTCSHCIAIMRENERLREELIQARNETRARVTSRLYAELRQAGMTTSMAWIAMQLFHAQGRVVSEEFILENRPIMSDSAFGDSRVVKVHICRLRKVMGADTILTHWGRGYSLAETGQVFLLDIMAKANDHARIVR